MNSYRTNLRVAIAATVFQYRLTVYDIEDLIDDYLGEIRSDDR